MTTEKTTDKSDRAIQGGAKATLSKKRWLYIIGGCLTAGLLLFVLGWFFLGFLPMQQAKGMTDGIGRPASSSQIYDSNGRLITMVHAEENRIPVPISKTPKDLQNAFVAAEDVRFYQHGGIDIKAIGRAIWTNFSEGSVMEGGSTITQQLAKNALLTQERTLKRKISEAFLALEIERRYSKQEILEMYLNQIYFGEGAYGAQSAAMLYFGKNVEELTLGECAMLAGLPRRPSEYSPFNSMKLAKNRQETVLAQMVKYGFVDAAAAEAAVQAPVRLAPRKKTNAAGTASYFVDYVVQTLIEKYGADTVYKGGLKIYTTLDLDMQRAAEQSLHKYLPSMFTDSNGVMQPQGALVAIEPQTGYIRAMIGGRGTDEFNRAVLAERQPGSAFKPFVYLAALQAGISPEAVVQDRPTSFGGYIPQNYDGRFRGLVTVRSALEQSLNVVAVRLVNHVGPDKPVKLAQDMGISTLVTSGYANDQTLAMALGGLTRGVTPLEITAAYGTLANRGVRAEPLAILKVTDRNGAVIEENQSKTRAVVDEKSISVLVDMMRGVILRGTGVGANIGRPAAGKTGTTNDYQDAWFIGFTPNLVAGVWLGCDNNQSLPRVTGGDLPAAIWRSFMLEGAAKLPVVDFPSPASLPYKTQTPIRDGQQVQEDTTKKDAKTQALVDEAGGLAQGGSAGKPADDKSGANAGTMLDKGSATGALKPSEKPLEKKPR